MFKKTIVEIDSSLSDIQVDVINQSTINALNNNSFDFGSAKTKLLTQGSKRRKVFFYEKNSNEYVFLKFVKKEIDDSFSIKYPNRNEIMRRLFNEMLLLKNLNDFVLIKVDLKSFFDSINSRFVYNNYIDDSDIKRLFKQSTEKYVDSFRYCYAGLNLSNAFAEIACTEFDSKFRATLRPKGLIFFERYVDDMFFIFNKYIDKDCFIDEINKTINSIFQESKVKVNMKKFIYISRRNDLSLKPVSIDFLGYNFSFTEQDKKLNIQFGITKSKLAKYQKRLDKIISMYIKDNNVELFRQRIKFFCSRIVMTKNYESEASFIVLGVISNYCELRNVRNNLDNETKKFLEKSVIDSIKKNKVKNPYFLVLDPLQNSMYNLMSNLKRNRAIIFHQTIGLSSQKLTTLINKLNGSFPRNYTYEQLTKYYLSLIKM